MTPAGCLNIDGAAFHVVIISPFGGLLKTRAALVASAVATTKRACKTVIADGDGLECNKHFVARMSAVKSGSVKSLKIVPGYRCAHPATRYERFAEDFAGYKKGTQALTEFLNKNSAG